MADFDALTVDVGGTRLVEASAGTGKTHAITTLVVRLLVEKRLPIGRILVVTFTEPATAELRDRVRARIREAARAFGRGTTEDADLAALVARSGDRAADARWLEAALDEFDDAAISTIHAFCQRVLHEAAMISGVPFDVELLTDERSLFDEELADLWSTEASALPEEVAARIGMKLSDARGFAAKVIRDASATVVPELGEVPPIEGRELTDALWRTASAAYDRARVVAALDGGTLDGRRYRRPWVESWCDQLEASFADPSTPLKDDVPPRFTTHTLAAATKRNARPPSHPFFDAWTAWHSAHVAREETIDLHALAFRHRVATWVRSEHPRRKAAARVLSFDDLLGRVAEALAGPSGGELAEAIRRRHQAALIDEFQDTDPVQYSIFESVFGRPTSEAEGTTLFFIGDPKQAIYSFRGADVFTYLRASSALPPDRRHTMAVNRRSDPKLVRAISSLFQRSRWPFRLADIGFPDVTARPTATDAYSGPEGLGSEPFEVLFVPRDRGGSLSAVVPDLVAAEIARSIAGGARLGGEAVHAGHFAVLTRTNAEAFLVQAALQRASVPSVVLGDKTVFEQDEAIEIQRLLSAVLEPASGSTLRSALCTSALGLNAEELAALESDEVGWELWVGRFRDWQTTWTERGFIQMMRSLMDTGGVQGRLLSLDRGERRMTNFLHLVELLHTAATDLHLGPTALLHWLERQRHIDEYAADAVQIRLESDASAVKITTVHKSKGLQYPIVYCPYAWRSSFIHPADKWSIPFHDAQRRTLIDVSGDRHNANHAASQLERFDEDLRLLYVALTRARHKATIVWGAAEKSQAPALGYLLSRAFLDGTAPASLDDATAASRNKEDAALLADLKDLRDGAPDCIAVRTVTGAEAAEPLPRAPSPPKLSARRFERSVDTWWRTASFSQLTAQHGGVQLDLAEGRDRDEHALASAGAEGEPRGQEHVPRTPVEDSGPRIVLAEFPRGAKAGNFFHDVLEHLDFTDAPAHLESLTAEKLRAHGFSADLTALAASAVLDAIRTPLDDAGLRLADVARSQRLDELEFHLPVASRAGERDQLTLGSLSQKKLAAVFRDHPSPWVPESYAERVGKLRFLPVRGHLKGYIDLVFVHRDRWYVVDYKTNHLGDGLGSYARAHLPEALAHSHYFLQYHLYALAVHRYLGFRKAGYDYGRDFGGVFYLFLKGMTPATGPTHGVFFEKPPLRRLEALSRLLDDPRDA